MHSYVCSPEPMTAFLVPDLSSAPRIVGPTGPAAATATAPAALMNVRREVLPASPAVVSASDMVVVLDAGGTRYGNLERTAVLFYLSLIHISEPTRQAEISYAVFCLKKKKKK